MVLLKRCFTLILALFIVGCNSFLVKDFSATATSSTVGATVDATVGASQVFYVDATGGNDFNDGLTPGTAWKTISNINSTKFAPGDQVLFERGETWVLSSSEGIHGQNGITYAAYGSGALPIIDGNHITEVFQAIDTNNITLKDLDLRNGKNSDAQFYRSSNINVINCEMSGAGNDNLIFIDNNKIIHVIGGKYHDPIRAVKGAMITNIEIADGGNDFTIDGVELYGAENAGISIHNHSSSDPQGRTDVPTNVIIQNIYSHDNLEYGVDIMTQDQTSPTTISISNSIFSHNQTGIYIRKTQNSSGYINGNILVDLCKSYDNTKNLFYVEGDDVTIQRSLFAGTDQQGNIVDGKNIKFLNNTIYANPSSAIWLLFVRGNGRASSISVKNNIFYMGNGNGEMVGTGENSTTNVVFDYNEYLFPNYQGNARWLWNGISSAYENWVGALGQDIHSLGPSSDPLFTNPLESDFTLQATSPAISRGIDVGLPFSGAAPDLGAFPFSAH